MNWFQRVVNAERAVEKRYRAIEQYLRACNQPSVKAVSVIECSDCGNGGCYLSHAEGDARPAREDASKEFDAGHWRILNDVAFCPACAAKRGLA